MNFIAPLFYFLGKFGESLINFWLKHEETVKHWKLQLDSTNCENLVVARITNFDLLRGELENLLRE